jgi:type VI secretion system secreted protein VgrG
MAYITAIEIERLKAKYYDPANPVSRIVFKNPDNCIRFDLAIVEDIQDPDKKGRIKVRFPHWGDIITNWVPIVRPYASSEAGAWMLPDLDTQVICAFFNDDPSRPIVLGSVYTPRALPPVEDNDENNIKVLTTRSGTKVILDDTDGEEKILIHTKDGAMRLVLDKAKGLSIVNENGDISVKCRKLIIEGKDDTFLTMNKDLAITCDNDTISLKAKGSFCIKSGKDAVLKGKSKISLKGNSGVTAGVQQIARKNDQVVGVDFHDIQVPTNTGLMTVPMIPHPYMGKLADKLSEDVEVNNQPAATKGSKSKFDTPGHIAMPPGVKFKSNPSNEGEVSSGVVSNVKINDKEAAVLGSMVKTCNDPQDQETCTIIAVGVPVILPILMPGMDPDQFKKDGGTVFNSGQPVTTKAKTQQADKQPKLQDPKWNPESARVGEEITLCVDCVDQYELANVTFTIWEEGADREKDSPVAVLKGRNVDGKAKARWRYHYIHNPNKPLTEKPTFIFTAKSFRCDEVESGSVEIYDIITLFVAYDTGDDLDCKIKVIQADGSESTYTPDSNGKVDISDLIPGEVTIVYEPDKE